MATKVCGKCNQLKLKTEFYKLSNRKDGLDYYCKYCRNGASLKSFRNKDKKPCSVEGCKYPHYAKTYCRNHYARLMYNGTIERKSDIFNIENPGVDSNGNNKKDIRDANLKWLYKIDINEYIKRASKGCEICKDRPDWSLHVDHDHKCCPGEVTCGVCVRGIICPKCNVAVDKYERGVLRPDYMNYNKIKRYIKKYA